LGGSEMVWHLIEHDYQVTLVNLPGLNPPVSDPSRFHSVQADACQLGGIFDNGSFDAAFSNSTIEHVGGEDRQALFAAEVRRLAPAYWVQTPSSRCLVEVHTGVPLFWSLPAGVREGLKRRWARKLPVWSEMIQETRILTLERMKELFPEGQLFI